MEQELKDRLIEKGWSERILDNSAPLVDDVVRIMKEKVDEAYDKAMLSRLKIRLAKEGITLEEDNTFENGKTN